MSTKPQKDLSIAELEALLEEKRKEETAIRNQQREQYEQNRDALITELCDFATHINSQMCDLKYEAMRRLAEFRQDMLEYGSLRFGEKNKGSFEIKNDNFKISFSSNVVKTFDERAELAEAKIKEFLRSFVKKRDMETFKLVNALLERNEKSGDFDMGLINRLYKLEDNYDDLNWKEGIRLFKEAYNPSGTAYYIRFFQKDEIGNWNAILLDFAKVKQVQKENEAS
jgi:hypothetical protein